MAFVIEIRKRLHNNRFKKIETRIFLSEQNGVLTFFFQISESSRFKKKKRFLAFYIAILVFQIHSADSIPGPSNREFSGKLPLVVPCKIPLTFLHIKVM